MARTRLILPAMLLALALLAAACGNAPDQDTADTADSADTGDGDDTGDGGLSGAIAIDGSSTVAPLTDAIAEEYAAVQPDVEVNIGVSGTGGGFERFCAGDLEIADASRAIKDEEKEACASNGIEFTEVRVGTDALTMVTSSDTEWVDCLTTEEIVKIWGPGGVNSWDEVRDSFPAEPIAVFAPGVDSGTYDFMNETVLEKDVQPRQDYNASEDDNVIAQGVIGTKGSWGYFGYAYFQESSDSLKAIAYDAGDGCVEPSAETARDDSYKLSRPLFIYVRNDALAEAHVADFVAFYLDTVNDVIEEIGYIAVTDEQLDEARAAVEEVAA